MVFAGRLTDTALSSLAGVAGRLIDTALKALMVLQIDLLIPHTVDGMVFQGCPGTTTYVTSVKILFSNDGRTYEMLTDPDTGQDRV